MFQLPVILSAGSCLTGSAQSGENLKAVLQSRLSQYHMHLHSQTTTNDSSTLEEVQLATANEALFIVESVQKIIGIDQPIDGDKDASARALVIGTRDLANLRTLLSITFKWGVDPLLARVSSSWPSMPTSAPRPGPKIVDPIIVHEDYNILSSIVTRLMALLFPNGLQSPLPQTLITVTVLNRHVTDLLRPCIGLGWLPKSLASGPTPPLDVIRPLTMRLLAILPPSQTISALGTVISSVPSASLHVHRTCSSLLSRQLLRPDGVRGLFAAVFGEGDMIIDDAPLQKLEHIAQVLAAIPAGMNPEAYFYTIIPRIVVLLSEDMPSTYRRAAAFSISRMLAADAVFLKQASAVVLPMLHLPFLCVTSEIAQDRVAQGNVTAAPSGLEPLKPSSSLSTLMTLVTNSDPSPVLISTLLSPIISALYSLLYHLEQIKTSDPGLKESLRGLLATWGRVVGIQDGIGTLWSVVDDERIAWRVDDEGQIFRLKQSERLPSLSLLTPQDSHQTDESREAGLDTNVLNLYPDPVHFGRFLKSIDRADISSELFVRLLEAYRESKTQRQSDPLRTLMLLQLVIQMQAQLSDGNLSSNILGKPTHMLSFVKHVLESATPNVPREELDQGYKSTDGLGLGGLRLAPEADDLSDGGDSDDDTPGSDIITPQNEITETAINLLLSILEANEDLSARTTPVLNIIFSLLEPLANMDSSDSIRPLAREARMVMTARLASTSAPEKSISKNRDEEDMQETYQKALRLLQDPILPVRAHGLLLLRELVTPRPKHISGKSHLEPLVPAILSIFYQCIQDDDSYMFLNAVQGLSVMVDTFGKDVLNGLVKTYTQGLDGLGGTVLTQQDVDTRIRIGEALGQVIRRCGNALGIYVDLLVPPLFNIVRSSSTATTLRTSSLSLLAECERTHSLSLLPYVVDLSNAMIDLLQVESVPAIQRVKTPKATTGDTQGIDQVTPTMDSQPTSTNSKFPPLRRAAVHFFSLLVRETTRHIYDSSSGRTPLSPTLIKRAKTTLAYVASTDQDTVIRVMAREAGDSLVQLEHAILGL